MNDSKENNVPELTEKTTIVVDLDKEKLNTTTQKRLLKLIESRSVRRDGTKTPIRATKPSLNEVDLPDILSRDDNDFYEAKKAEYVEKYPELEEDPFDMDDLHLMMMEQIFQRHLLKKKKKHPAADITEDYQSSVKRQNDLKKSLSMRRQDRVSRKESKKSPINIANLSVNFGDHEKMDRLEDRIETLKAEEEALSNKKIIDAAD